MGKEVGLSEIGEYVARETAGAVLARVARSDDKDFKAASDIHPFDFEMATGASAQSLMGAITTAHTVIVELTSASDDDDRVDGTLSVNFGSGAVTLTGSIFRIQQDSGTITACTVTHASGAAARIRGFVAGT